MLNINETRYIPNIKSLWLNSFFLIRKGIYEGIKDFAPEFSGKMLDFGCGEKPYQQLFNVDEYTGVDIDNPAYTSSREAIDVYYDGKKLDFDDEVFDCVMSTEVFEHIFNLDDVIDEIHRVMKRGGKLLISIPFIWEEHEVPYDYARYSSFGIVDILNRHGFTVIRQEKKGKSFEVIFQLICMEIYYWIPRIPTYVLRNSIRLTLIPCATLLGLLLGKMMPNNPYLYLSNVILAVKD